MSKDKAKEKKAKDAYGGNEPPAPEEGQTTAAGSQAGAEQPPAEQPEESAPMVALSMEEYDQLQKDLEQTARQSREYFDGWQRERADFSNFRRRIEREQAAQSQVMTGQIIKKYLTVVDDLERALKNRPSQGEGAAWADGIELVLRKLQNILDGEGVKRIPADGDFDPTLHEAITHEDSPDHHSGQVIETVQTGYMIGDRVLRAALVRVAQ